MQRLFFIIAMSLIFLFGTYSAVLASYSDSFEDGVIDSNKWLVGGFLQGSGWQYSHQEVIDPTDGYLKSHVWGPTSGISYGATAWVRTTTDFNDCQHHAISFKWKPDLGDSHFNSYYIQVTDGYIPDLAEWYYTEYPGTLDLVVGEDNPWGPQFATAWNGWFFETDQSPGVLDMSITIDPSGVVRLYESTMGLIQTDNLGLTDSWYIRFALFDATSGGYPAGDASLNLYDFNAVPIPSAIWLLGSGLIGIVGFRRKFKKA